MYDKWAVLDYNGDNISIPVLNKYSEMIDLPKELISEGDIVAIKMYHVSSFQNGHWKFLGLASSPEKSIPKIFI